MSTSETDSLAILREGWEKDPRPPIKLPPAERKRTGSPSTSGSDFIPDTYTAADLGNTDFAPVAWTIPDYLPQGLTILGGRPKVRKTWTVLHIGLAKALGAHVFGQIPVEECGVLALVLEDNPRRMKKRLSLLMTGMNMTAWPDNFHIVHSWPFGNVKALYDWLVVRPHVRFVIIDTFGKFRARPNNKASIYLEDTEALSGLQRLASELCISVMVVHHTRKGGGDDPLDELSGSTGIAGAADCIWILKCPRLSEEATLLITGRDIEQEQELALLWNSGALRWDVQGNALNFRRSESQKILLDHLKNEPMTINELVKVTGKHYQTIYEQLQKLAADSLAVKRNGKWMIY